MAIFLEIKFMPVQHIIIECAKCFLRNLCDICFLYGVCFSLSRVIVPSSHIDLCLKYFKFLHKNIKYQYSERKFNLALSGLEYNNILIVHGITREKMGILHFLSLSFIASVQHLAEMIVATTIDNKSLVYCK